MSDPKLPVLYVKAGCPWCVDATAFLDKKGVDYREVDVLRNPQAMDEMVRLSGQTKAPTLKWADAVLADFGVDELEPFVRGQISPWS